MGCATNRKLASALHLLMAAVGQACGLMSKAARRADGVHLESGIHF
jgi:hypothetical protein